MDKVERWSRVGIIYHLELPEGEIFVSTNELYLSLVIENLLDNANKFTDSGSITLKMRLDKAQSKLRIEVTDTGCGIPPEKREEIFLCFIKLDEFAQGNVYLANLHTSFLCNLIYPTFSRILLYSC